MPSTVEPELPAQLAMAALPGRPRERVCGDGGQLRRNGQLTHVIGTGPACALCLGRSTWPSCEVAVPLSSARQGLGQMRGVVMHD